MLSKQITSRNYILTITVLLFFTIGYSNNIAIGFTSTSISVVENSYLDICVEVQGDYDFTDGRGYFFSIRKSYSSGHHFDKYTAKNYFI